MMKISDNGRRMIEQFESLSLTSYRDIRGIWTNGYGETGANVFPGQKITKDTADNWLSRRLISWEDVLNSKVIIKLTQNQFDACVSLMHNIGSGSFVNSTLRTYLNQNEIQRAANQFTKWVNADGKIVQGLVNRRNIEKQLFLTPDT